MIWYEISIITTEEACETFSDYFMELGVGGVAIENPNDIKREVLKSTSLDYADDNFLKNLGNDVVITAYFPEDSKIDEVIIKLKNKISEIKTFFDIGKGEVLVTEVDEEDWANSWKKYYKTFNLTEKIIVKPSWEDYESKDGDIVIEMDPGMAFGTGTHETTRMCSLLLEKYQKGDQKVLDAGTGTGILSIVSAKLGAKKINAFDVDSVAVRVANENIQLNGVSNQISTFIGLIDDINEKNYDIIVANIIANIIIDISNQVKEKIKTNGLFITSGIIKDRKNDVIEEYKSKGFEVIEIMELGEWVAMVLKCRDSL